MSELPPRIPPAIPLQYATPQYGAPQFGGPSLRAVALAQRRIMWVILGMIVLVLSIAFGAAVTPNNGPLQMIVIAMLMVVRVAVLVLMMISIFLLSKALGNGTAISVVYLITMLISCINLIVLLMLNQSATSLLKENRIRVGLMGARLSDLPPQ